MMIRRLSQVLAVVLAFAAVSAALAQDDPFADADSSAAAADSLDFEGLTAAQKAILLARAGQQAPDEEADTAPGGPFFRSFKGKPLAGTKASVRQYSYYWELETELKMRGNATFKNTLDWSWDEFRRQDKTVEKYNDLFYLTDTNSLPFQAKLDGKWNWSEDKTVNSAGVGNLNRRDNKTLGLELSKHMFRVGPLVNVAKVSGRFNDQKSINQGHRNDFNEGVLDAGLQAAYEITPGLSIAGRAYNMANTGERTLGEISDSSTADGDSLGFGVYYGNETALGRAVVTRSNFNKNYLDFVRNSNALIDTVGLSEEDAEGQPIHVKLVEHAHGLALQALLFELGQARGAQKGAALVQNAAHRAGLQGQQLAVDQSRIPPPDAHHLDPIADRHPGHRTDTRVQSRAISAAGQYANSFDLAHSPSLA